MKRFQARQGDVIIERVQRIPGKVTPVERDNGKVILAYGEVTGNSHAVLDPDVELLSTADAAERFLRVGSQGATVVHEEHGPITLAPGNYRVRIQREYSPEAIRNVAD